MSIDGQNALPPEQRLVAASIAKTVMTVVVTARTWAWRFEVHTTLAGRRSIKNFGNPYRRTVGGASLLTKAVVKSPASRLRHRFT
jgi:hypothetical protein